LRYVTIITTSRNMGVSIEVRGAVDQVEKEKGLMMLFFGFVFLLPHPRKFFC